MTEPSTESVLTVFDQADPGASISETKWTYASQLQRDNEAREAQSLPPPIRLPLAWNNLAVRGRGSRDEIVHHADLASIFAPWTTWKSKKRAAQLASQRHHAEAGQGDATEKPPSSSKDDQTRLKNGERYLLKDFSGVLQPGEMMLVVGRPGSGCSTFLKSLSGMTDAYAGTEGEVKYGSMTAGSRQLKPYRSLICYNSEEDEHDPNLTVGRTMDFATRQELVPPAARLAEEDGHHPSDDEYRTNVKTHLLDAFGIRHTHNTKVGNQYVRGVSGGERKRVSLAEALSTDASIFAWDNATRGLDASTALDFVRTCRATSDIQGKINVMSLYQAGNGIYDLFDKVTVIADGLVIYYGPRSEARPYFEGLGMTHIDGANTADYLTAVTALAERRIDPDYHGPIPTSANEFADIYQQSDIAKRMRAELDSHLANHAILEEVTTAAQHAVDLRRQKGVPPSWANVTSFPAQVRTALIREYQQRWGSKFAFWGRYASAFLLAWITGSVFYDMPKTTTGLFLRGGSVFSALVLPVILTFADVQVAFEGRPVLAKHKAYNMYRPAAHFIAQTLADLPLSIIQLTVHNIIIYFMGGFQYNAGLFFAFLLFSFTLTGTITALFRAVGYAVSNYNDATKITGGAFTAFVVYSGYVIYQPAMHPWLSWIRWINPLFYMVEADLANELDGLTFACAPPQLAPYGSGYQGGPASCAITGAAPGETSVSGANYLDAALDFHKAHVWRNWGIVMAWWVTYIILGCIAIESIPAAGMTKGVTLFKRNAVLEDVGSNEKVVREADASSSSSVASETQGQGSTFTWKDLDYTVKYEGKDKQLLNKVSGYCKAGTLTALMGSSGAGKTTLMDVLAARKDEGVIHGEVLLNGHPLPVSFQRQTGYCEQLDVHLPTATVREALEFSALLRQPRHYSREEKLKYVDVIIDLLELHDLADAIVGQPGAGLGVEQRKRLTIGVELVSRPTLLFLDEPTSGLDGQSSYMILQFMRKLAHHGQSILCTIHQPSAALFAEFDQLLLLKGGGRTVYFGSVEHLGDYFAKYDTPFPAGVNPAEYMIDVVSGSLSKDRDWAEVWLQSEDRQHRMDELEALKTEARTSPLVTDDYEYASPFWTQVKIVCERASVQLFRDTEYVMNKILLHITVALLIGFSYWNIGNAYADLQNRMFALFNFIFVAPGVMVQTQPKFIANRDIFEKREKRAKLYSWVVFCIAEIVAELPYLVLCAVLFWCCWYPTAGLDLSPGAAGPVVLTMFFYELLYTGMAQFIAAYAPNPPSAALFIPVLIATLVTFSGVLVPYSQLNVFWRYWLYYIDPFKYLLGALMTFTIWDVKVTCNKDDEYGVFDPPAGSTCGAYMSDFLSESTGYLRNPNATSGCEYCGYSNGREYLANLNLTKHLYAYRDMLITLLFCFSSYALVFLLLKLRSKRSKLAE